MDSLANESIVLRNTLTFRELAHANGDLARVNLRGRIVCAERVVIAVNEWLAVRRGPTNRYQVLGESHSYHAFKRASPRVDILRYDDAHGPLHRHYFDAAGREIRVEAIELETLPRLDFVVREAVSLVAPGRWLLGR